MYLKSIEVHGFKSFANKIVFKFHDGITAIVGPNGSGKSNVADAVRWVLGEQSAKQLRGSKMEDVIFSGTQLRKPMGYAYVAITLDNSDHKLPIDYEEVTVARRVYRSGESEYLINGSACRLRDVQEMFFDTGIGKEGYSIIGQGQIDKVLSGKPEDRRELFDEAAGIVKYKRRKAAAEKELAEEQLNLSRISDILSEIEKQVEPLKKQSETAKEFLRLKEALKRLEINLFLLDYERSEVTKEELGKKSQIVSGDIEDTKAQYGSTKLEYERLETELEQYASDIDRKKEQRTELLMLKQKREGEVTLMQEKISSLHQSDAHYQQRKTALEAELASRQEELLGYENEKQQLESSIEELKERQQVSQEELYSIRGRIAECTAKMEECNRFVLQAMNQSTEIKTRLQRFATLEEQNAIKKAAMAQKILQHKSEEAHYAETLEECRRVLLCAEENIAKQKAVLKEQEAEEAKLKEETSLITALMERLQKSRIEEASKLEALRNLTERYDGYGNSIRRVMEKKTDYAGIVGVVADIIKVDKRYETAIETALGASIQNIVTKDEATAKQMVEYLKANKFGRATFLPLTSITANIKGQELSGEGIIGYADALVSAEKEYDELKKYLLGRSLVVDTLEHALVLAKKYHYSLRIVTLDGEQLSPGGSISGGAYKNNSNLLGRRREMEEGEKKLAEWGRQYKEQEQKRETLKQKREELRNQINTGKEQLQSLFLEQNTAELSMHQEENRFHALQESYTSIEAEAHELERQNRDNRTNSVQLKEQLKESELAQAEAKETIERCSHKLDEDRRLEQYAGERGEGLRMELSGLEQSLQFTAENIQRVKNESVRLNKERETFLTDEGMTKERIKEQENGIQQAYEEIAAWNHTVSELETVLKELEEKKDEITKGHKNFFAKREELSARVSELDKESFRLSGQLERILETMDTQCNYMWEEYEITVEAAKAFRDESISGYSATKKEIGEFKAQIKALGDVNVNAIEDFKTISERFELYTTQKNDLMEAEAKLRTIIEQLDQEMRRQFEEKFAAVKEQFNIVFCELFGGGKGTLELMEDEDVLTAGIRIIAQPPGKKLQNMMQLSGGEKALTAIALLFAIQNLKPSPFCLLDEIEAALDDSNVGRYAKYLHKLTKHTQFIVITHRRGTMASADILYGITMQEKGISTLVAVNLIEDELEK